MAIDPKNNEWIHGTNANTARVLREKRDDAIRNAPSPKSSVPLFDSRSIPLPSPRSGSPSFPESASLPDGRATHRSSGRHAAGSAGKPIDLTKAAVVIGGVFGAIYAAAHGATSGVSMFFAFVLSGVAAGVLFRYAKWLVAFACLAGLAYALSR